MLLILFVVFAKQNKTKKTIGGTRKLLGGLKTYKYNDYLCLSEKINNG